MTVTSDIDDRIERRIITGLIISSDYIKLVQEKWQDRLIESPEYVMIARWCFDHYNQYGRHPGREIDTVYYLGHASQLSVTQGELIEACFKHISDRYGTDYQAAEDFDPQHLYDQTVVHFRKRALELGIENAITQLDHGQIDDALLKLAEGLKPTIETTDEGAVREAAAEAIVAALNGDLSRARVAGWKIATAGTPPDKLADPWAEPEPPAFDSDWLPPVLRKFALDVARNLGGQLGPIGWNCLTACGIALSGDIALQMKVNDPTFIVPPRIWSLSVGRSGQRKSPCFRAALSRLNQIQNNRNEKWRRLRGEWLREDEKTRGTEPQRPAQLILNEGTIEGIRDLLTTQNRGIGIVTDEWGSFIGSLGRYSGGRDSGMSERGFYNKLFDGDSYSAVRSDRRRGGDLIPIRNMVAGVLGGVSLESLHHANKDNNLLMDGFLQRCAPILMEPTGRDADFDIHLTLQRYNGLIDRLVAMPGRQLLFLSEEAHRIRERVADHVRVYEDANDQGMGFTSAASKLHGIWGRIALILAHVMSPTPREPPQEVDERAALLAEKLVFDSLIPNMLSFYKQLGSRDQNSEITRSIASYLLRVPLLRVRNSDITKHVWPLRGASIERVREAMSPVVGIDWVTPEGGDNRRANAWTVNQAIYPQNEHRIQAIRAQAALIRQKISQSGKQRRMEQDHPDADIEQQDNPSPDLNGENSAADAEKNARIPLAHNRRFFNHQITSNNAREGTNRENAPCAQGNSSHGGQDAPDVGSPVRPRAQGNSSHGATDANGHGPRPMTLREKILFNSAQSRLNHEED